MEILRFPATAAPPAMIAYCRAARDRPAQAMDTLEARSLSGNEALNRQMPGGDTRDLKMAHQGACTAHIGSLGTGFAWTQRNGRSPFGCERRKIPGGTANFPQTARTPHSGGIKTC